MREALIIMGCGKLALVAFLVFLGMLIVIVSIAVLIARAFISSRSGENCGN
jgi:hypothetical protein